MPLELVNFDRHRADLNGQRSCRLIDQVDCLVRQKAVRDVAVRKSGRGYDGGVLDAHIVVGLVPLFETAQNGDGVFYCWLAYKDDLKTALQGGIFLDVFAIFIESGRADGPQLTSRQGRFQHVGSVDGAFGCACPYQGVQFVDEEDDAAMRFLNILEHGLEPVFELAAIFRACQHGAQVKRDNALVTQQLGDVAGDDPARQTLNDGGLAHSRLADQYRIVLGPARQHLDHAANLFIPPDHRIQLPSPRKFGQVLGVTLQGLVFAFWILIGDSLVAAHRGERLEDGVAGCSHGRQQQLRRVVFNVCQRQQQMLGRYVLVLEIAGLLGGLV